MDAPNPSPSRRSAVACQRWRITFGRDLEPPEASGGQGGREYAAWWEQAIAGSGLPIALTEAGKPRLGLGAALPAGITGRGELLDIWTTERLPAWRVRESLERCIPQGHRLVALDDVWLGAPPLVGRIAAADYQVTLRTSLDRAVMAAAAVRLLAADKLVRERSKGGGLKTYDLRPLLISIEIGGAPGAGDASVVARIRARIHPEIGSGRPEEVVAALAEEAGAPVETLETIRERLVMVDDLDS